MKQPSDYLQRAQALDPMKSFAVTAPAGSGKTELLAQRVLRLLPSCEHPEQVVCLTFTRKAAGEMRERITNALLECAGSAQPADEHKRMTWNLAKSVIDRDAELGWGLLKNPSRLRITTIDGLCRSVALQMPLESGLGGVADTLDNPSIAYQKACRNLFKHINGDDDLVVGAIEYLYSHFDNDISRIENLLSGMLANRIQWLPQILSAKNDSTEVRVRKAFASVTNQSLRAVSEMLSPYQGALLKLMSYASRNLDEESADNPFSRIAHDGSLPDAHHDRLDCWKSVALFLLTAAGSWRKTVNVSNGFPTCTNTISKSAAKAAKEDYATLIDSLSQNPDLINQLKGIPALPNLEQFSSEWDLIKNLSILLPLLAAELDLAFKELGAVDFTSITLGALKALSPDEHEHSELALKLDYSIKHILIDEFQDTSTPQLMLLEQLTEGWYPGDGKTVFLVGDGMQSIYSFRDANVGIFLNVKARGLPNVKITPLNLTENFRSHPEIVRWINSTFSRSFPEVEDIARGAVCYAPSTAFKDPLAGSGVTCHAVVNAHGDTDCAELVARIVKEAKFNDPKQTIAILVKSRSHLKSILPALKNEGLRWQATEIDSLASRQAIIDMMTITRVLNNAGDRIAWLSFLRAPWAGLSLSDLHALVSHPVATSSKLPVILNQIRHHQQIANLSDDGRAIMNRVAPLLLNAWDTRRRKRLRASVEGLWLAIGGPATLLNAGDEDDIRTYLSLLDAHEENSQIKQWHVFESAVESLYAAPHADADPTLQVMTIHKSKGLEFDTVIIPGTEKAGRADDKHLLITQEWIDHDGDPKLLMATLGATGDDDSSLYRFLRSEKKIRQQLENTRLLYVGATRAIRSLHLVSNVTTTKEDKLASPGSNTLLNCIWSSFNDDAIRHNAVSSDPVDSKNESLSGFIRLPVQWKTPDLDSSLHLLPYRGAEINNSLDNVPSPDAYFMRAGRYIGIVIHRMLCDIGKLGSQNINTDYPVMREPLIRSLLTQQGMPSEMVASAASSIVICLQGVLSDPTGQWILNNSHDDSEFEYELCSWSGDDIQTHVIDRIFSSNGERWIIDYKSGKPGINQSIDEFISAETAKYREQLTRYRNLFHDEVPTKTALYFPQILRLAHVN